MVRVSYILTTRNRAEFLDKALENVREYITAEDELIVIDGASTDNTAEVIEKHRDIVTLFQSEPDCGEAHGLNKGILASSGRYIKLITDDDYFYPEAMHRAIAVMEEHPELDAVMCGGEMYEAHSGKNNDRVARYFSASQSCCSNGALEDVLYRISCGLGLILARKSLSLVGLFDATFRAVDTEYLARLMASGANFQYLNIKLYHHTRYPHSGALIKAECQRDMLRVLLRHKRWGGIVPHGLDPLATSVGHILGINELPGGRSLAKTIWYAESLRRSRFRPLLSLLALVLETIYRIATCCLRILSPMTRGRTTVASEIRPPVEPEWDGKLMKFGNRRSRFSEITRDAADEYTAQPDM